VGSGVLEIRYVLDGGVEQVVAGSLASFSVTVDGDHSLQYWAVDNSGNVEVSSVQAIRIDRAAPSPTSASVTSGTSGTNGWYVSSSIEVTLSASDALSGVASITYILDGWSPSDLVRFKRDRGDNWRFGSQACPTMQLMLPEQETPGALTVMIDSTPPTMTLTDSKPAQQGLVQQPRHLDR